MKHEKHISGVGIKGPASKNNPSVSVVLIFVTRGALTNKLQKADKAPPKGTRLEVGTQLKVPFACFPDFDQLKNDEKYWAVREVLDKIAKTLGKYLYMSI